MVTPNNKNDNIIVCLLHETYKNCPPTQQMTRMYIEDAMSKSSGKSEVNMIKINAYNAVHVEGDVDACA